MRVGRGEKTRAGSGVWGGQFRGAPQAAPHGPREASDAMIMTSTKQ